LERFVITRARGFGLVLESNPPPFDGVGDGGTVAGIL